MTGRPRLFNENKAIDAAMKVFWVKGYEGASYAALSKAMSMNTPSIYGAFGNKEELYLRAIDRYAEVYCKPAFMLFDQAKTCREGLESLLYRRIKDFADKEHPGCLVMTVLTDAASQSLKFEAKLKALVEAFDAITTKRLQRGIEEGDLPAKTNPKVLARIILNLIIGFTVRARAGESERALRSLARDSLDFIFGSS
jgi:AcrR family transcriptional regulator